MPAISLAEMAKFQEEEVKDDLVFDFLELFTEDDPLQREDVDEWRLLRIVPVKRILSAAEEAIKKEWVRDTGTELYITEAGMAARRR